MFNVQGEHQRSGENQARATVSDRSTSDGEWRRDVKVGRGGERLQGASPVKAGGPVLLGGASSWQPLGVGPAPPLGNGRLLETGDYVSSNGNIAPNSKEGAPRGSVLIRATRSDGRRDVAPAG